MDFKKIRRANLHDAMRMEEVMTLTGGSIQKWIRQDPDEAKECTYHEYVEAVNDPRYICNVYEIEIPKCSQWLWDGLPVAGCPKEYEEKDLPIMEKVVIGFTIWERLGDSANATSWRSRDLNNLEDPEDWLIWQNHEDMIPILLDVESDIQNRMNAIKKTKEHIFYEHFNNEYSECFFLGDFAVDPKYQRQGIATTMINWGKYNAELENVCLGAAVGHGMWDFFRRRGFVWKQIVFFKEEKRSLGTLHWGVWITPIYGVEMKLPEGYAVTEKPSPSWLPGMALRTAI
ncbi:MAG: hypothetical protein MMC33_008730 [Icmadophila ericetorum]|nr:hypothetical protein [Icmadophila ericetorum]